MSGHCYRRVVEVSPEKAPDQKTSRVAASPGSDSAEPSSAAHPDDARIPPSRRVELLDLESEGVHTTSRAASDDNLPPAAENQVAGHADEDADSPALEPAEPAAAVRSTDGGSGADVSTLADRDSTGGTAGDSHSAADQEAERDAQPQPLPTSKSGLGVAERARGRSATPRVGSPPGGGVQPQPSVSSTPQADPLDAMPRVRPSSPRSGAGDYQRTGHPVRDRLMAKAAEAARSAPPDTSASEPANVGPFSALRGMEAELEQLAGPRQKLLSEPVRVGKAVLSPSATLVGITLIGLAVITSLFLFLVKFAPKTAQEEVSDSALVGPSLAPAGQTLDPNAAGQTLELPPAVAPPERKREPGPWRIGSADPGQRVIRGSVGSKPFLRAIQDAGIEKNQAYRIYAALKGQKDLDHCRPKDEFIALVNRADKRVTAFEYVVSKEEVYQAKEQDGKLVGKALDLKVNKHRVQGSILVTSAGFGAAARNAGLEPNIADVVNRALSGHTSVSQFRPGDRLRVVAQEVTVLGEFHRYAGIEALEYLPVDGDPTRIYYHAAKRQYYDAKGRAPGEGGWRSPVRGAPITSKFNPQRLHPILKKKMPHNGTDFGAPTGTPIYAASYGKITKLGNYGANGNFVAIEHDNGYETGYSHLSRFEPGLKVGDSVKRAQVIGYVGSTGRSTGPHLHFSARKNGAYIDPESLHLDALTVLPAAERAVFQGIKEKYDALLEAVVLPPALPAALAVTPSPGAPSEEDMHGEGAEASEEGTVDTTPASPAPGIPQVPLAQPGSPLVGAPQAAPIATAAAPAAPGGLFFLSDKDLLQNQPAVDDGEVDE